MKRIIGNFLIVTSIFCLVITILWIRTVLTGLPEKLSDRMLRQMLFALLIAVVLLSLECSMFLYGRYLRLRYPAEISKRTQTHSFTRLLPLIASLGCSIVLTIFVFHPTKQFLERKALLFMIGQGSVLAHLTLTGIGELTGIDLGLGVTRHIVIITLNLLYYVALFYPVFRIVTMDRNGEVTRYRLMKILLVIFVCVHILIGFIISVLVRA